MKDIELTIEPWHLSRDGEGYTSRRKGMSWTVWKRADGEGYRSVKSFSSLSKVREWLLTQYGG